VNRRTFITKSVAGGALLAGQASAFAAESSEGLVDTHLHCFAGTEKSKFPYHSKAPYRPAESSTPQHLLKCMNDGGIRYAVVVHPEPYQDDHRYLEYCLDVGKGRLKGTALVFSDRPGSIERLPELVKRMDIAAVRVHAYAPDRLPPFGKPELRNLWRMAGELGVAVQIHFEPRYAPGFEPYIQEFKTTKVYVDHLGRPFQGTPEEYARVMRWARFPNVIMKLSSIPSNRSYPHRSVLAIIAELVEAFGPDRLMYGGGFGSTATGDSYRSTFERARGLLSMLSAEDQAKVLGGNAIRLMGFQA
jgi:predicted TIM-barrel fold metal-dependent hydrolase